MHTQVTRSLDGGEVAGGMVLVHARQKFIKQALAASATGRNFQCRKIGRLKPESSQRWHGCTPCHRNRRQRRAVVFHRIGTQVKGIHFFKPGVFIRREHAVGLAGLRQHFLAFKNHMVFEAVKSHAGPRQGAGDLLVPCQRLRLIVVVGKDRVDGKRSGQLWQGLGGAAMQRDQTGLRDAMLTRQLLQLPGKINQRLPDKLDAAVCTGQGVEDVTVQHEHAKDLAACLQRVV